MLAPTKGRPGAAFAFTLPLLLCLVASGFAVTALVVAGDTHAFDRGLMPVAQEMPFFEPIAWFFNEPLHDFGIPALWLVTVGVLFFRRRWEVGAFFTLAFAVAPVNHLVKLLIDRPRPAGPFNIAEFPTDPSFPSGHTALAVGFFGAWLIAAGLLLPPRMALAVRVVAVSAVALTAYSRLWAGAHWPTDVLASVCFGFALVLASWLLVQECVPRTGVLLARARALRPVAAAPRLNRELDAE